VVKGQATPKLLDSYSVERAPIARQIVTRANQSITEFGPIFEALGMDGGVDHARIEASMAARCDATEAREKQREALGKAIDFKVYEFDCHGVEMNQRYASGAVVGDGTTAPVNEDMDLYYIPTTSLVARLPHAWVYDAQGTKHSTLDLCGKGQFTVLTGIGGEAWVKAAEAAGKALGLTIRAVTIGPRVDYEDHVGDGHKVRDIRDGGCVLIRPDQHVAWRSRTASTDSEGELMRVLRQILGH
jgi:2,4-dichlorophenol 6-monooxygenase